MDLDVAPSSSTSPAPLIGRVALPAFSDRPHRLRPAAVVIHNQSLSHQLQVTTNELPDSHHTAPQRLPPWPVMEQYNLGGAPCIGRGRRGVVFNWAMLASIVLFYLLMYLMFCQSTSSGPSQFVGFHINVQDELFYYCRQVRHDSFPISY